MQVEKKMGRPKKRPQFDQAEPWAQMQVLGGKKFIVQEDAYFTYAEPTGPFVEELMARKLEPYPQFIMWKKEYELEEQYAKLGQARIKKTMAEQELLVLTDELKAKGVIIDEGTSTSEGTGSREQSIG